MAKADTLINQFNGGELSRKISARSDIAKYHSGCRTLENMVPLVEGGAMRMPGSYFVVSAKDSSKKARLIPFSFSTIQAYVLEFGENYIRVYKDNGQVLDGGSPVEITTTYAEADLFSLKFTQSADILYIFHPSYAPKQLSRTSHIAWTLSDYVTKTGPEMTITGITKADPAVVTAIPVPDSLTDGAIVYIKDVAGMIEVNNLYFEVDNVDNSKTTGAEMTITDITNANPAVVECSNVPTTLANGDKVYIDEVIGMTEVNKKYFTVANVVTGANGTYELSGINSTNYGVYGSDGIAQEYTQGTFDLKNIDSTGYTAYTSGGKAQETIYGLTDKFPSCGTFFEQRMALAGSNNNPQTINLSGSDNYDDFTLDPDDDSAGIQYTIVSDRVDRINWMVGIDYIMIGTVGGIWKLGASNSSDPLSQSNISVRRQPIGVGAKNIAPVVASDAILWTTRSGIAVRRIVYSLEKDSFIAPDMTRVSKHIALGSTRALSGVVQMDVMKEPIPILWAVRQDGQLLGMTYEIQEEIYAWFRGITDGVIESLAVISNEDDEDQIWVIVKRTINGSIERHIEFFMPFEIFSEIENSFFVHSGLTWDGGDAENISNITNANPAVVTITGHSFINGDEIRIKDVQGMTEVNCDPSKAYTVANKTADTFELSGINSIGWGSYSSGGTAQKVKKSFSSGLSHLEAKSVVALVDGAAHPAVTVSSGAISLSYYGNLIHIGLNYSSIIEPSKIHADSSSGTTKSRKKKIGEILIDFYESVGCKVGPDTDNLKPIAFGTGSSPTLFTGEKSLEFMGDWGTEAKISIVQDLPLPMTVLALVAEVEFSD